MMGMPGTKPRHITIIEATRMALGLMKNSRASSWPMVSSPRVLVTSRPEPMVISSEGIWLTRPSPMVRIEKVVNDWLADMCIIVMPMMKPAMMLMMVMIRPAIASPLTNLLAPSMAP